MSAERRWASALALYLLVAAVTTLPGLGATGLIKMEGMVADMAAAMLRSGDFVVPRLFGEVYTYKPPLVYWLTALSMKFGGRAEWALRLPSALALVAMGLAAVLFVGRLTRPRVGLLAGLAAISSMMIFSKSKLAEFDAVLACTVGIAVAAACYNLARERRPGSLAVWWVGYAALAAAFLAKGSPALMAFGPGIVAAALVSGRGRELWNWRHLSGVALFVALVGAYLGLLWNAAGPGAFAQPLAEAQQRGLQWTVAGLGRTLLKPLMLVVGFLPWSLAWFWKPAAAGDWRAGLPGGSEGSAGSDPAQATSWRLYRASLAFLAAGALVFMVVPTYEPRYFLPLSVPGAIVAALALERGAAASAPFRRLASGLATLCSLLLIAACVAPLPLQTRVGVALAGAVGLVVTWAIAPRWPRRQVALSLLVAGLCGWVAETAVLRPERARARDVAPLAAELDGLLPAGETIWIYGPAGEVGRFRNVLFYLDRPVRAFRTGSELPASGAWVIARQDTAAGLTHESPDLAARLETVHIAGYRGSELVLYNLRPAG